MGGLLGPVGGLRELRCASSLSEEYVRDDVRSITEDADAGEHVQLYDVRPNRMWSIGVGTATPDEMHELVQLSGRMRRDAAPMTWYSEAAQVENILDPGASQMDLEWWPGLIAGGSRVLPDGALPGPRFESSGSCPQGGAWGSLERIPIPEKRDVSISIHVTAHPGATAVVRVDEVGLDGQILKSRWQTTTGTLRRLTWQIHTMGATTSLSIHVQHALTVVAPQITLTQAPPERWMVGTGSLAVIVMRPPSREVQLAIPDLPWGTRSSYAWTIREIGRNGIA